MAFGSDITETLGSVGGRTSAQGFNSADDVRKQYTGYERDDESGLDYAQARYYNSNHGRFTSVDPLTASANVKDPQTFNRYSYALNSPYKFTDPLGLISEYAGSACGNRCRNSDGSSGPTALDDNSWKVWRLPERGEVKPPAPPPTSASLRSTSTPNEPCTQENPDFITNALTNGTLTDRGIIESVRYDEEIKGPVSNGVASHDGIHLSTSDGNPSDITALGAMEGTILHSGRQATTGVDSKLGLVDILLNQKINGEQYVLILKDMDHDTMQKTGKIKKNTIIGRISKPTEGGSITLHVTLMPYSDYKKYIQGKESAKARNSVPFNSLMDAARGPNSPFRRCLE